MPIKAALGHAETLAEIRNLDGAAIDQHVGRGRDPVRRRQRVLSTRARWFVTSRHVVGFFQRRPGHIAQEPNIGIDVYNVKAASNVNQPLAIAGRQASSGRQRSASRPSRARQSLREPRDPDCRGEKGAKRYGRVGIDALPGHHASSDKNCDRSADGDQ